MLSRIAPKVGAPGLSESARMSTRRFKRWQTQRQCECGAEARKLREGTHERGELPVPTRNWNLRHRPRASAAKTFSTISLSLSFQNVCLVRVSSWA
jgi:hypothetical protein